MRTRCWPRQLSLGTYIYTSYGSTYCSYEALTYFLTTATVYSKYIAHSPLIVLAFLAAQQGASSIS